MRNRGGVRRCVFRTTAYVERMSDVTRTQIDWHRLRQRNPGTDGETRQCEADERDCCPVVMSVKIVVGVEPTTGQNAEADSDRGEATGERQCRPDFESVLCDFSCGRSDEEDAGRYRGRGCRFVGGHQLDFRRNSENCGDAVPRTVVSTEHRDTSSVRYLLVSRQYCALNMEYEVN